MLEAAKYLAETSDLHKSEGITIKENWIESLQHNNEDEDWKEFIDKTDESSNDMAADTHMSDSDKGM